MSLVVLRSWSDGPPPKIKGIINENPSDIEEGEIVPDHKGQFTTAPPNFLNSGPIIRDLREAQFNSLPRKLGASKHVNNYTQRRGSGGTRTLPNPGKVRAMAKSNAQNGQQSNGHNFVIMDQLTVNVGKNDRMRHPSSPDSDGQTPPISPGGGKDSRYKKLTRELAATIPKRQLKNINWVGGGSGDFWRRSPESDTSPTSPHNKTINHSNSLEDFQNSSASPSPISSPNYSRTTPTETIGGSGNGSVHGENDKKVLLVEVIKKDHHNHHNTTNNYSKTNGSPSQSPGLLNGNSAGKPPLPFLHLRPAPFKAPQAVLNINRDFNQKNQLYEFEQRNERPQSLLTIFDPAGSYSDHQDQQKNLYFGAQDKRNSIDQESVISEPEPYHLIESNLKNRPPPQIDFLSPTTPEESPDDEDPHGGQIKFCRPAQIIEEESSPLPLSPSSRSNHWFEESNFDESAESKLKFVEQNQKKGNQNQPTNTMSIFNGIGPVASARVPVQCVNKLVKCPDVNGSNGRANGNGNSNGIGYEEWRKNSNGTRDSFRGFCQDFLKDQENGHFGCDDIGVINFEDDSISDDAIEEMDNCIDYLSVQGVQVGSIHNSTTTSEKMQKKSNSQNHIENNRAIIALDFGSNKCSYATYYKGQTYVSPQSDCTIFLIDTQNPDFFRTSEKAMRFYLQSQNHSKLIQKSDNLKLITKWRELIEGKNNFPYSLESIDFTPKELMTNLFKHFGLEAIEQLEKTFGTLRNDVSWVLSIPSSWSFDDRKIIRDAVWETGLLKNSDSLSLITDPLASFYSMEKNTNDGVTLLLDLGASYLHWGVFEFDIEIPEKWQMLGCGSELQRNSPNLLFEQLLGEIFSREFILRFKDKCRPGWVELLRNWENAKRAFDPRESVKESANYVFIPHVFAKEFTKTTNMELEDCMTNEVSYNENGALIISQEKMEDLLNPQVDSVIVRIEKLKREFGIEKIYITGGASKSKLLNFKINQEFNVKFISKDPELSVLHGALISKVPSSLKNHSKIAIKSPFSLGVGVMTTFDPNYHPQDKKLTRGGQDWCRDVWDSLIKTNGEIGMNEILVRRTYVGAQPGQSALVLPIFKCQNIPKFTTENGVEKCCELKFDNISNSDKNFKQVELFVELRNCEVCIRANDICVVVDI